MYRKLLLFMTIAFALFMFSCKKDVNLDYEGECKNMRIAFLSGESGYASVEDISDMGDEKRASLYTLKNEKIYGVIYFDDDYTDSGMKTKVPAVTINFETGTTPELTEFTFNKRGTFKNYKAYKFLLPVEFNYIETHGSQELLFKIRAIYGYSNDDVKESSLKITCKAADPEDTYNIDENDFEGIHFLEISDKDGSKLNFLYNDDERIIKIKKDDLKENKISVQFYHFGSYSIKRTIKNLKVIKGSDELSVSINYGFTSINSETKSFIYSFVLDNIEFSSENTFKISAEKNNSDTIEKEYKVIFY